MWPHRSRTALRLMAHQAKVRAGKPVKAHRASAAAAGASRVGARAAVVARANLRARKAEPWGAGMG